MTTFLWILTGGIVLGIIGLIIFSRGKKPCPVGIMLSLCLSIACAIMFVVDISVEPVKNINSQQPVQGTVDDGVDTSVTFAEIYRAYKENELRADDTYKNNRYQITAKVNGMETGGLFNLTGGATLTMEIKVDNTIVFFYAEFEKEQEEALKTINVGDTITFDGECLSAGTWVECELLQ